MNALATQPCQPRPAVLSAAEIAAHLQQLQGWSLAGGAIEKRFDFSDDLRALAFVNAVAWIAHREDHHPDIALSFRHCTLRWSTHSVGGLSRNDFICAAKVDGL